MKSSILQGTGLVRVQFDARAGRRFGLIAAAVVALSSAAAFAAGPVTSPYATGGEVTTFMTSDGFHQVYVHTFTNASEQCLFRNIGEKTLTLRYLVVGAGGAGGKGRGSNGGGGGGGGGGVYEDAGYQFPSGGQLAVTVGRGGAAVTTSAGSAAAGASSLSDGEFFAVVVPGGGNGAYPGADSYTSLGSGAMKGAGGGGGTRYTIPEGDETRDAGAAGTYQSSQFGKVPAGTSEEVGFSGGAYNGRAGGGGGGAVAAGSQDAGGAGLVSDITGESRAYGAGGGGGGMCFPFYDYGGKGGEGAGNGGTYELIDLREGLVQTNLCQATAPVANSGCGGGGGLATSLDTAKQAATDGADGIVVIRYQIPLAPCAGGDVVTCTQLPSGKRRYVHVFTNVTMAAQFVNWTDRALKLRCLVVGAGGAGAYGSSAKGGTYSVGGAGGGGGGVCEMKGVRFAAGTFWSICVGKGAARVVSRTNPGTAAGASSISNATGEVVLVPGGGNGARGGSGSSVDATAGAAGGGTATYASAQAGAGMYQSSVWGLIPDGAPFAGGTAGNYCGGGGGGAGAPGTAPTQTASGDGGEGLASDITGESLVYGSGGGGGANLLRGRTCGHGGTRAGNGATYEIAGATTNFIAATAPVANSGCGGAGGMQDGDNNVSTAGADGVVVISYEYSEEPWPCEGGDIEMRTLIRPGKYRYVHVFTNVLAASQFENMSGRDLKLRYLVVGAGGAGAYGSSVNGGTYSVGGAGGGGGGVCEVKDAPFSAGALWSICVGKGAACVVSQAKPGSTAGSSSISNATGEVVQVPGGGNGARGGNNAVVEATAGAAGGGTTTYASDQPGAGTYQSSVWGVIPDGAPFAGGGKGDYCGAGGGGAGAPGTAPTKTASGAGGEGLVSDITGEALAYGSGGGGGANLYRGRTGGFGGTRAGNGATYEIVGGTTNFIAATAPVANSGCGGAGGMQDGKNDAATAGADGIVVIGYDYSETEPGCMLIVR